MNAKKIFRPIVAFLCLLFAAVCAAAFVFSALNKPPRPGSGGEPVVFTVEKGAGVRDISTSLRRANLIRSDVFAYLYVRFYNLSLKAGTYRLSPSMSASAILRTIDEGSVAVSRVTIPEGLTLSKTAAEFVQAGIRAEDFIRAAEDTALLREYRIPASSAEGYLFPDTYFVAYGTSAEQTVRMMVSTFFQKASSLENFPGAGAALHDKVVLASIVEREYRVKDEAPLIAGVFKNRLDIGMGLQSCATVEYIITELQGKKHPDRLTAEDIAINSPYNTYLWAGLPPGPISNPGLTALAAAFSPARTRYFYFRLNDVESGTHTFTASLDDHIEAGRGIYLKRAAGGR